MCGQAYLTSARIAEASARARLRREREPFLDVIRMHRDATAHRQPRVPAI
jgi:hypothetical protein